MAKKFIKTIYVTTQFDSSAESEKEVKKIDLYETDCFISYAVTYISGKFYQGTDKKGTKYFNECSTAKKYLDTEFDQALANEFERQSKEYKEKETLKAAQSKAKKEVDTRLQLLTGAFFTETEKFKGDWVEFSKKITAKTEEMYQDFLKFMKENNN